MYMKNLNIENKDNKISQGRGNSLRNEVRDWVELGSLDPQLLNCYTVQLTILFSIMYYTVLATSPFKHTLWKV